MATSSFLLLNTLVFTVYALAAREVLSAETAPTSMMEYQLVQGARPRASHRPTTKELIILQDRLGYKFKEINLLMDALTHSSFSEANNDVLHVLGGKSVQQAIALHLMGDPDVTKSALDECIVRHSNTASCAKDAIELGLDSLVMVGKGVESINSKILSSAFNAIFGAIAIDDGPTTANFAYWTVKKWKDHHADVI